MLTLATRDGQKLTITRQSAMLSGFLKNVIDEHHEHEVISLGHEVKGDSLTKIVAYLDYYANKDTEGKKFSVIATPLPVHDLRLCGVNDFDFDYVSGLSKDVATELLKAADYLDIQPLVQLLAAKLASIIKSMPLKDLMEMAGVKEFTPEWEEKVRKDNPWCKAIQK